MAIDLVGFFTELRGYPPYKWQLREGESMLRHGKFTGDVSVPTGCGKTDLLVWGILGMALGHFTRLVHIINRRVLVSEFGDIALEFQKKLRGATSGVLKEVADLLRARSGGEDPLQVLSMQGGVHISTDWLKYPTQPTIMVSTINHAGLRLLFDAPGASPKTVRMHAGLMAYDTYMILDEADSCPALIHTLKTAQEIMNQAERNLGAVKPLQFIRVSATIQGGSGLEEEDLRNPGLKKRLSAPKRLELYEDDDIPEKVVGLVTATVQGSPGPRAYCVFMNTVRGAHRVAQLLRSELGDSGVCDVVCDVDLITGRMRPLDRWDWMSFALPAIKDPSRLVRPLVVVATQTLEIGVDIGFYGVFSEACDLRALVQRAGRCNRSGEYSDSFFVVVSRKGKDLDPIYGISAKNTVRFLKENFLKKGRVKDLGYHSLESALQKVADWSNLIMEMPPPPEFTRVSVDALASQAKTRPSTIELLHGTADDRDVTVLWRSDLLPKMLEEDVPEELSPTRVVEYCPPMDGECLTVPYYAWRQWLETGDSLWAGPDLEDWSPSEKGQSGSKRVSGKGLRWEKDPDDPHKRRGVVVSLDQVRPGDTIILPGGKDWGLYDKQYDLTERAALEKSPVLRLNPMTIQEWGLTSEDLDALLEGDRVNRSAITRLLRRLVEEQGTAAKYAEAVLKRRRVVQCPRPGYYVICTLQALDPSYLPARVLLESHQNGVAEKVVGSVQRLRLPDYFMKVYRTAALGHDRGKADSRWQRYIKGTKTDEGVLAKPLEHIPNVTIGRRWRKAGLPSGWRHEERSVRFYERLEPKPSDPEELTLWELTRHLILTHHGHFAPVPRLYEDPTGVKIQWDGCEVEPSSSGIRNDLVQSYVKLQRIFGYWGLCFLEAIFRAGDWAESAESSERDKS